MKNRFEWFIITGFFSGLLPKAPGTWGSVVGIIIAYLAIVFFPNPNQTILLLAVLFSIVGYKTVNNYEKNGGIHDDKRIVIDEIAGVLIAVGILGHLKQDTFIKLILAFLAFRLLDIWKPSVIGKVDKNAKGAMGVMGDDILAGIFGGIFAGIVYVLYLKIKGA